MIARRFLVLLVLLAVGPWAHGAASPTPSYKGPLGIAFAPSGKLAYVAQQSAGTLAIVDWHAGRVLAEIPVGRKPHDVALGWDMAYVTCEVDDTVVAVDLKKRKVVRTFRVGQAPRSLAFDPSKGTLRIVCHDARALWILQPATGRVLQRDALPPQPEGNFARASNLELMGHSYRFLPRPSGLLAPDQPSLPQRTAFNPALDIDYSKSRMDLVAHTRPRWFTPTVRAQAGRSFTTAFSFFLKTGAPAAVVLLDEPTRGYPDPTDVVVQVPSATLRKGPATLTPTTTSDKHPLKGARAFISSGGGDAIVVLDLQKAGKHFETHPPAPQFQSFNGFNGGLGWRGNFGGGNFGNPGAFQFGGGGFQGVPPSPALLVPGGPPVNSPPTSAVPPGSRTAGPLPGGPPVASPPTSSVRPLPGGPPVASPPTSAVTFPGQPAVIASQLRGGGFTPNGGVPFGNFGWGGGGFGGQFGQFGGQFGGMVGWQGSFFGPQEDLTASRNYTLARLATQANPRRLALSPDGAVLLVSNHLSDSLTVIDAHRLRVIRHISLGGPRPNLARRGEMLFHSARLTHQQQFTCASCHPGGGSDGLQWNTSPKGDGEHLDSRALWGVGVTGPFGWKGEASTLADRALNTMREVHRHKLSDANAAAIAAFVGSLPPRRPLPQNRSILPAIARGKALFTEKGQCIRCHRGDAFESSSPRGVIANAKGEFPPFDVPSLRAVGRTAPYLHDGRAATLEEIFLKHNPKQRHGRAHLLSRAELGDLVAFLKSL